MIIANGRGVLEVDLDPIGEPIDVVEAGPLLVFADQITFAADDDPR